MGRVILGGGQTALFAVHNDMHGHSGGKATIGKGSFYLLFVHQRLNTKSSTETELVAADNILPQLLWLRNFMTARSYKINAVTLFQDNISTMSLEQGEINREVNHSTEKTKYMDPSLLIL